MAVLGSSIIKRAACFSMTPLIKGTGLGGCRLFLWNDQTLLIDYKIT